ncbi:hypothetical protein [Nonomuraea salmonea]|uniref:hypothetical protein n=1 Tax=Nonomuraea salmonea TaxID=46181 RepID=UPI0031E9532E
MVLFGMAFGVMDVAMNAQGSAVEQAYRRPLMNGMHAGWCVGAISAGALGALAIAAGLPFTVHVTLIGLLSLPVMVLLGRTYLPEPPAVETPAQGRRRLPPVVYLLGAIMFFAFMVEGTVADWNGLYLRDELGAPEAVAALGYPVFEVGMLIARLTGDRLRVRFGVRGMLTVSGGGDGRVLRGRAAGSRGGGGRGGDVLRRARRGDDLAADAVARGHRDRHAWSCDRAGRRHGVRRAAARPRGDRVPVGRRGAAYGAGHRRPPGAADRAVVAAAPGPRAGHGDPPAGARARAPAGQGRRLRILCGLRAGGHHVTMWGRPRSQRTHRTVQNAPQTAAAGWVA